MRAAVRILGAVLLVLGVATVAPAAEILGVRFADQLRRGDTELVLANVGLLRYHIFIKAYVAALYLGKGVERGQLFDDVPKRLEIEYFYAFEASEFAKATTDGIAKNVGAAEAGRLAATIERFGIGFAVLLVPAVAMGATLPVLVKALAPEQTILADFNGALDVATALETLRAFHDPRLVWEEPCRTVEENLAVAHLRDHRAAGGTMGADRFGLHDFATRSLRRGLLDPPERQRGAGRDAPGRQAGASQEGASVNSVAGKARKRL